MRNIIRIMIVAVALAALSAGAVAYKNRSEASSAAHAPTGPASPPPTQAPREIDIPKQQIPPVYRVNPDRRNPTGELIEVSIDDQRLTAWRDGKVVYRFVISTGRRGYETPAGHYKVAAKVKMGWSRKWSGWMPWMLPFYGNYSLHQLPHKDGSSVNIGASKLGTPDSHGCVRVNVGDAEILFNWASVGTPVWVH